MIKYEVKPVVSDYGIYEDEKLKLILNDRQNALEIQKILEMDQCRLRYTKWQDDVFNSAYVIAKKLIEDNSDLLEIEEVKNNFEETILYELGKVIQKYSLWGKDN